MPSPKLILLGEWITVNHTRKTFFYILQAQSLVFVQRFYFLQIHAASRIQLRIKGLSGLALFGDGLPFQAALLNTCMGSLMVHLASGNTLLGRICQGLRFISSRMQRSRNIRHRRQAGFGGIIKQAACVLLIYCGCGRRLGFFAVQLLRWLRLRFILLCCLIYFRLMLRFNAVAIAAFQQIIPFGNILLGGLVACGFNATQFGF